MQKSFARARFLETGLGVAGIAVVRAPARAAQFEYRCGSTQAIDHPVTLRLTQMWASIERESGGRIHTQFFPASQLGGDSAMFEQLRTGSIHYFCALDSTFATVVPAAAVNSVGFAFASQKRPYEVLDGPLGAYVRREFSTRGAYAFERIFDAGFRELTSSTKAVKTADDLAGMKIRTPTSAIFVDLFKTLGASPVPLDVKELYIALQTHIVDGQDLPLEATYAYRLYEVQKYLSLTGHAWGGFWLTANLDAWNALPPDLQTIVRRNQERYATLERNDSVATNGATADKLRAQGLAVNTPDVAGMRARLGGYYARWKSNLGGTVWGLLEAKVGKLG